MATLAKLIRMVAAWSHDRRNPRCPGTLLRGAFPRVPPLVRRAAAPRSRSRPRSVNDTFAASAAGWSPCGVGVATPRARPRQTTLRARITPMARGILAVLQPTPGVGLRGPGSFGSTRVPAPPLQAFPRARIILCPADRTSPGRLGSCGLTGCRLLSVRIRLRLGPRLRSLHLQS